MDRKVDAARKNVLSGRRAGWIGAGKMGAPMALNLLSAGVDLVVTEPREDQRAWLSDQGATAVDTLAHHAESPIVFATLPNDDALLEVALGRQGSEGVSLSEMLRPGAVFVEMSTVSPQASETVAKALAAKAIHYLRAPLSGSTAMAEQASLTILASGDETAWDAALPFLKAVSAKQLLLGLGEEARYMKLVLNTLVGASSAILAEALNLGEHGGLSRSDMMKVICESAVASPLFKYKVDAVVSDDYSSAFSVAQMMKDFTLISDAARHKEVPLLVNGLILELYRAAANAGLSEEDFFSLVKWHRNL
ncbi:NAD(P)-dependent oxidoreductase [Mesorhizobium xinjiangense]|uniref:NAD(P)-dependent oxidoreductase n=1 Tax=Mesorhizobium xinjiangense TaxID=2678685 RepID=UPI0012ECEC09|nr:NAD(P)-dependent oxidoreductase [Mesorhizobium xinjiangense]